MNCLEFSNEFDTLLNSYAHTILFGNLDSSTINLDEYEKSIFLTKALEEIVKELYSGKFTGDSFESTEKLRRELQILVELVDYPSEEYPININTENSSLEILEDKYNHVICTLPEKLLYIVYELVKFSNGKCTLIADVYPTTHDEYWRVLNNPFRGPNNRRVLRLDKGENLVELVSNKTIDTYTIRYLKYPEAIDLVNTDDSEQVCKLDESLHRIILDRAVRLALISKNINIKDNGSN